MFETKTIQVEFELALGTVVRDTVTGFQGKITAASIHLNGCHRYVVEPPLDKDSKIQDGQWFDAQRLEVIKPPVSQQKQTRTGGPTTRVARKHL